MRTPPPVKAPDKWYSSKYADMYDMYSQQFTLSCCLVKSLLLRVRSLFTSSVSYAIP